MNNTIVVRNKKVIEKVSLFKNNLSKKLGKNVPTTTAIELAFTDQNYFNMLMNGEVNKKKKRKNKYEFTI